MRFTPLAKGPEDWWNSLIRGALVGSLLFLGAQIVIHTCTSGWKRQSFEETLTPPALILSPLLYLVSLISMRNQPERFGRRVAILATSIFVWSISVQWLRSIVYD